MDSVKDKVNESELVVKYISQFTPSQKIAYEIASSQLKSSFCIEKSIGFLEYKKSLTTK